MEVRSSSDSVMTPQPYWKCFTYWPSARAFIKPPHEDSELERSRRPKRKKARAHHGRARAGGLEASDVRRLQALGAGGHFEFNRLAFVQRLVPLRLDGGKVDENVLAGLALDESESLTGVEPLHCSLFFQCFSFSVFKLFGAARTPPAVKQKGCKCGLAAPLNESKGFTRATNANQSRSEER